MINKKTGHIVKPKSSTQKQKAAYTRRHNIATGKTKPRKK